MANLEKHTNFIKAEALRLGFSFCGISKSQFLEKEAPLLEKWLKENRNGKMTYMENYFDMRLNPGLLVEGAKSVISLLYNYHNPDSIFKDGDLKVSQYAYGEDYHLVVRDKLNEFISNIRSEIGEVNGRAFVDSAPVLEKAWASRSGLGWIGKNGNLINKKSGSYYFISELILDLELIADLPVTDHCGNCTACIDACPTQAIYEPGKVDGSKCISYFTIELKEQIPVDMKGKFDNWIFGCDACMLVCPWNKFAQKHHEPKFEPNPGVLNRSGEKWLELTEDIFKENFKKSPIMRTKYNGLKRNVDFILK